MHLSNKFIFLFPPLLNYSELNLNKVYMSVLLIICLPLWSINLLLLIMVFIQFTKVILCVTLLILKLKWNIILYLNLESFYSTFTIRVYYQEKNSSWKSVQSKNSSHFVKFLISKGNSLFSRSYYAWKRKRTFFTLFSRRKTGYSLWSLQNSCQKP